jgi:Flp pilus assembly pilin Flp
MLTYISAALNLPQLPRRQRGLTTVEYAIAGALIVIVVVAALTLLGTRASSTLNKVGTSMS